LAGAASENLDGSVLKKEENVMRRILLAAALVTPLAMWAGQQVHAAEVTQQDLMQAAETLGKGYDDNYNSKNAAGMAALYASDGVLVSATAVTSGTDNLKTYYQSRFDAGAGNHLTKITEVHVQGNGGFGVGQVSATVPTPDGGRRDIKGNLVTVYQHGADGWHLRLVIAAIAPPPPK
jgi:ketosteroid isomerase-like protein